MSSVRKRDRRKLAERSHLVLVRGGLDRAAPVDPDWQSFCDRIGWQRTPAALPDDYEERLLGRIFREDQPITGAPAPERPRARRTFAAAANVAVMAVLCAAASAMLWWSARPPVSALPRPDAVNAQRAIVAPVVDADAPTAAQPPRDPAPRARSPRSNDVPKRPAPTEAKPANPRTVGPGSAVAQRSRRDEGGARRRAAASVEPTSVAALYPAPNEGPVQASPSGFHIEIAPHDAMMGTASIPQLPRTWPEPTAPDVWTRPASFGRAAPASATWSLSPESPRWYGVALPPSGASAGLPPAVGVMAQLDVGKAFDRF